MNVRNMQKKREISTKIQKRQGEDGENILNIWRWKYICIWSV